MRKLVIALMLTASLSAMGQTIRFEKNAKCDVASQISIRDKQHMKDGKPQELKLLAKVSAQFDAKKLQKEGITVGIKAGNIVTLRLPSNKIGIIDNCNEVLEYSISHRMYPHLDKVRFDTRTDSVHQGLGLTQAFTGEGVLIGITDWGFDYKHPNYNNLGESNRRLLRAWDQFKLSGPHPDGFDYGTEYANRHDLLAAQCDTFGLYGYHTHGTHVAGIAAGRGIDGKYMGQAPYANLLFASFMLDEYSWLDAVEWMKGVAREEGKRLVVNSSWGMYTFSTLDGTSLLSQAINNYADSGIVFVTSGGNNGSDNFHVMKTFHSEEPDTLRTIASWYGYQEIGESLILWGEPDKPFSAAIGVTKNGQTKTTRWIHTADGNAYTDSLITLGNDSTGYDTLRFSFTIEQANRFSGRPHMLIDVQKNAHLQVRLFVTASSGTVHAWNVCNLENGAGNMGSSFISNNLQGYTDGDNSYGVGEPACAAGCLSVAAHASDIVHPTSGTYIPGHLASFSSVGPLIDGRRKPEVSAPGVQVVSSINSYYDGTPSYNPVMTYNYASRNYTWSRMSGTSMSAPATTGVAALVLQANPNLSAQQVRDIICSTARNDETTGPLVEQDSMSDGWGWGKVDALRAVNEALSRVDILQADNSWYQMSLQTFPNPAEQQLTIMTGRHEIESVYIYNIKGQLMLKAEISMERNINIANLPSGVYIVKCGARTSKFIKN